MSRLTKLLWKLRSSHPRPGQKLVFLHLPKTGGTTLHSQIARQFAPERIFPGRWPGLKSALAEFGSDYDLFSGHFSATEINLIPGPTYRVTVLRDPRQRLLSLYYFFQRQPAHVVAAAAGMSDCLQAAQTHDLLEFLRHDAAAAATDNTMAKTLAGDVSAAPFTVVDVRQPVRLTEADVVDRAIANLEHFNVIGFTEHLDDAFRDVARDWGFPPVKALPQVNARTKDCPNLLKPTREQPITRAIEEELDRLTVLDRAVFEQARLIQNRRLRGLSRAA